MQLLIPLFSCANQENNDRELSFFKALTHDKTSQVAAAAANASYSLY